MQKNYFREISVTFSNTYFSLFFCIFQFFDLLVIFSAKTIFIDFTKNIGVFQIIFVIEFCENSDTYHFHNQLYVLYVPT
jgi:hypothetical protein